MRPVLPVVLAALVLAACSGGGGSNGNASTTTSGATTSVAPATTSTTIATTREIALLDPGRPPRTELRYRFTAGSEHRQRIIFRQQLTQSIDGTPGAPVDVHYSIVLRNNVTQVAADGTADSTVTVDAVEAPPGVSLTDQQRAALQQIAAGLVGATIAIRTDPRGVVTVLDTGQSTSSVQQAIRASADVAVLLPVEAVGRGARWTQTTRSAAAGVAVEQGQTVRLDAVDGARATLVLESATQTPLGPPPIPGLPSTATVEVKDWTVTSAQGRTAVDLAAGTSEGSTALTVHQVVAVTDGSKHSELTQDVTVTVTMAPVS